MRAAVRSEYGGPEVVRLVDLPDPRPGAGELLVRVHATTVNRTDCAYRSGQPWVNRAVCGWPRPRVQVLGSEYAGVVTDVGAGVGSFAVGDRVFGFVDGRPGAHAELVAVPADGLVAPVPPGWSLAAAAPAAEGAHYALAFVRVARLTGGQRALVHGATGAIGSALVQLLRAEGVAVTAVCDRLPDDPEPLLDRWEAIGVDRVVDLRTAAPGDGPYDAVLDAAGKSTFGHYRGLLRRGGSYVSSDLGAGAQNLALAAAAPALAPLLGGRRVRFPVPRGGREVALRLADLMASGVYRPLVDRTVAFEELREAYAYVDSGRKVGNVVVTVLPD